MSEEAIALHNESLVVDLHSDTITLYVRHLKRNLAVERKPPGFFNPLRQHVDIPRAKKGGVNALGCGSVSFPRRMPDPVKPHLDTMEVARRVISENPDDLGLALAPDDIIQHNSKGRIALFFGVEGAHALGGKIENLQRLFDSGLRYMTLSHFTSNEVTACATDKKTPGGLTEFGKDVVREMNRLGMIVDCAHVNQDSILDVADITQKPFVFSHTGVRAGRDMWRNIGDEQIQAVASTDGCIGIIFQPMFIEKKGIFGTADRILDHMEHIIETVGDDHAALGSDFDGFIAIPADLKDISQLPRLTH
ncbi:MAG: membrane dipeptidase, partial [bacterium]